MTRRDRHIRLIKSFGDREQTAAVAAVLRRNGLDAFDDEMIEEIAREIATSHRSTERRIRANRLIYARVT